MLTPSGCAQLPIGCARYSVSLKKPLGMVLEQDVKSGNIFVVGRGLGAPLASWPGPAGRRRGLTGARVLVQPAEAWDMRVSVLDCSRQCRTQCVWPCLTALPAAWSLPGAGRLGGVGAGRGEGGRQRGARRTDQDGEWRGRVGTGGRAAVEDRAFGASPPLINSAISCLRPMHNTVLT